MSQPNPMNAKPGDTPPPPDAPTARIFGRLVGLTRHHIVLALGFQDLEIPLDPALKRAEIASLFDTMVVVTVHKNMASSVKPPRPEGK